MNAYRNTPEADECKTLILNAMAVNFGEHIGRPLLTIWLRMLEGFSPEQVETACMRVMQAYKHKMPPIAILLENIPGWTAPPERTAEEAAADAAKAEFDRLAEAAEREGRWSRPACGPAAEYALRSIGGWDALCDMKLKRRPFVCQDFVDAYLRAVRYGADNAAAGAAGICAAATTGGLRRLEGSAMLQALQAGLEEEEQ